jgi:hypothetical protein
VSEGVTFKSAAAVARYLDGAGYAVTDDTVRNHVKAGILGPDATTGRFLQKTVDRYAELRLKLKATGDTPKKTNEKLQERKLKATTETEELKARMARIELEKEEGRLVEIDTFLPKLQSAIAACRTRMLQIPLKPTLNLDLEQRAKLDTAIRDVLNTLCDFDKLMIQEESGDRPDATSHLF